MNIDEQVSNKSLSLLEVHIPQSNARMYFSVVIVLLGAMSFGLDQGNFGAVAELDGFKEVWCVSKGMADKPEDCDKNVPGWGGKFGFVMWGATLIPVGAAFGALLLGPILSENCGRRMTVTCGSVICFIGCLFSSVLSFESMPLFLMMRWTTGFGVGVTCSVLSMYNSEVAVPSVRGFTGSLFQFFVALGCAIGVFTSFVVTNWKIGIMLPGMTSIIVAVLVWVCPESPRWLMQHKGYEAGKAALQIVRAGDCTPEADSIKEYLDQRAGSNSIAYRDIFTNANLKKRFLVAAFLQVGQQFSGVNAFLSYSAVIFAALKLGKSANPIFQVVMIVFVTVGLFLIDSPYGGRRWQLILASSMMTFSMLLGGVSVIFEINILTLLLILMYGAGFQLAWGAVPWLYPSEIFTQAEKDKCCTISASLQYIANTFICGITPLLVTFQPQVLFFTFGTFNIVILFIVLKTIKETKGVPIEEIPALFD